MTTKRCSKLIAWLLALVMVFSMVPVSVFADGGDVISPVYQEGTTLEVSDTLGLNGKSGALTVFVNGKYTAVINAQLPSSIYRRVAKDVTVIDGKIICRSGQEPSIWTITKAPDGDRNYYLKNGNQYLTLTEKDGVVMTTTPTAVLASVENGKYRFSQVTGEGTKWLTLRNNKVSDGFSCDTLSKGKGETYFDLLPVEISDKVNVAFNCNGAPNNCDGVEKKVGETITLPDYEGDYSGHELVGWKSSADNKEYKIDHEYILPDVASITFTAVWEKRETVKFNANGGDEDAPAAVTIKKDATSVILPDYNGKKTGYEFTGWAKTATPYAKDGTATAEIYSAGDEYPVQETGNKLYAVWTFASTVTVQFNSNGAPNSYEDLEVNVGDEITLPDYDGDYIGRELTGWKMSVNNNVYSVGEQFTIPATEHVIFTAVWEKRNTVTFNANGGSGEAPTAVTIKDGMTSITLPDYNGTKNGQEFIGWAEVSNILSKVPDANHTYHEVYLPGASYAMKAGNTVLYAVYNATDRNVTFGIRMDGIIQDEPSDNAVKDYKGHFTVNNILKTGHWVIDIDSTKPVNDYYVQNNVTAALKWVPSSEEIAAALKKEGNIDFDPETQYIHYYVLKYAGKWKIDGVIRNKANVEVTYNVNVPKGTDKTKVTNMPGGYQVAPGTDILIGTDKGDTNVKRPGLTGYFFMGWNTKADGSGEYYHESTTIHLTENLNLYAQWIAEADNPLEIRITSDWTKGRAGYVGAKIKLTAALTGFEGKQYTLQWQYSTDKETWYDVPDAHDETYTYILDETTTNYYWRVVAQDIR